MSLNETDRYKLYRKTKGNVQKERDKEIYRQNYLKKTEKDSEIEKDLKEIRNRKEKYIWRKREKVVKEEE